MKDRPIIFSAPMARALLEGRKTQTRRLASSPLAKVRPGDRLWVREAWHPHDGWNLLVQEGLRPGPKVAVYRADRPTAVSKWRPSIHMPRWASRLTLTVSDTRRQRLQDISAQDCIAEGIDPRPHLCGCEVCALTSQLCPATASSIVLAFAELWRSLHGAESWDANPEVVALTFTVELRNIDSPALVSAALKARNGQ